MSALNPLKVPPTATSIITERADPAQGRREFRPEKIEHDR
jgi:hypothetical protein